jgi:NTE family protein
VLLQNRLPTPVQQIELTQPPNMEFTLGLREIHDGLSHASLFHNALDQAQRESLAALCKAREFPGGGVLMKQGEPADAMYIVLEGAISITIGTDPAEPQEVAISATGDVVGEMSLMLGTPRTATVTALTRVRAIEITKEAIGDLFKTTPELLERFSRVLAQRQLENESLAARKLDKGAVEGDILAKMRNFFTRAFGLS